jgi:hypothetical protein
VFVARAMKIFGLRGGWRRFMRGNVIVDERLLRPDESDHVWR